MKPSELITIYQELIDDSTLAQSTVLSNFKKAFDVIWLKRSWEIAKTTDDTKTISNKEITLPTNFLKPLSIYLDDEELKPIKREDRRLFKDILRYYIDWKNRKIVLTGTTDKTSPIYMDYVYKPDNAFTTALIDTDIETTIPGFFDTFQYLLVYEAAKMFYYQEVGSKNDNWSAEMQMEYDRLYSSLCSYDSELKTLAQNSSMPDMTIGYRDNVIE